MSFPWHWPASQRLAHVERPCLPKRNLFLFHLPEAGCSSEGKRLLKAFPTPWQPILLKLRQFYSNCTHLLRGNKYALLNFSDSGNQRETKNSLQHITKCIWRSWGRGERSLLSLVSTSKPSPVPEGQTWGKAEILFGKITKLLRFSTKKEYFMNKTENQAYWHQQFCSFQSQSNTATPSGHASRFLPCPSHPPHCLQTPASSDWF